jgi:hypothetical protein
MKFSLISVTHEGDDGRVSGYWVQDHIGTLETAYTVVDDDPTGRIQKIKDSLSRINTLMAEIRGDKK